MKLLNYSSDNFWELLDKHLSLRHLETSSKIEDDVRFIIEDVKKFGDNLVLENVSASFFPGKINLIIGRSGSGKTVAIINKKILNK